MASWLFPWFKKTSIPHLLLEAILHLRCKKSSQVPVEIDWKYSWPLVAKEKHIANYAYRLCTRFFFSWRCIVCLLEYYFKAQGVLACRMGIYSNVGYVLQQCWICIWITGVVLVQNSHGFLNQNLQLLLHDLNIFYPKFHTNKITRFTFDSQHEQTTNCTAILRMISDESGQ